MKRAIFLDLDSTTTHRSDKHKTTQENINAIKTAQKRGIYTIIATGRSLKDAEKIYGDIMHDPHYGRFIITSNGSFISDNSKTEGNLRTTSINYDLVERLIKFATDRKVVFKPSYKKSFYGEYKWTMKLVALIFRIKGYPWVKTNVELEKEKPLGKFSMVPGIKKSVLKFIKELKEEFDGEVQITTSGGGYYVETTSIGVSKGSAAEFLAEKLEFKLENSAHFGDSSNDIELLKKVGYSFAVKNASKKVKASAKYETSSDKDSGVAKGIRNLLHNEWK